MYLPVEEFDPLSRLFLEVLRQEHSIPRLVRAFGLTERVVEDVLGDLIRRNRATLVIKGSAKEIRLLEDATPSLIYEPGEVLDVWQDQTTGLVLPARIVDQHNRPREEDENISPDDILTISMGSAFFPDFIAASDAQLIEALIRSDEELRQREDVYGILDRLTDRYRVRPQAMWLPLVESEVQGRTIPLILSEHVPAWVARVWSVALRRGSFCVSDDAVGFHAEATTDDEGFRLVHGWRVAARSEAWRAAVDRFLRLVPAPLSGYELRDVREEQAALSGLLASAGKVKLLTDRRHEDERTWLDSIFDASRDWIILILPWPDQVDNLIKGLQRRLDLKGAIPNRVIAVLPESNNWIPAQRDILGKLLGPLRHFLSLTLDWPPDGPALALSDNAQIQLRYSPRAAVLRFTGERIAADWLALIQSLRPPLQGDPRMESPDQLRRLRIRRDLSSNLDEARLGGSSNAPTVATIVDNLRSFGETLFKAIVDPEQVMLEYTRSERDASPPESSFNRRYSLIQQLPFLSQNVDELSYHVSLAPAAPWAFWTRLIEHDLLPTLIAMLTEPSRHPVEREIYILAHDIGRETQLPNFRSILGSLVDSGWSVHIGLHVPGGGALPNTITAFLDAFSQYIASLRLKLWNLTRPIAAHALVRDDVVFLAGGDWLNSVLQQKSRSDFGFAFESRELAEDLRATFIAAAEIR
jgi:hypothetical protein